MPANIETDPYFVLLTDALRAGPGSPQWHDAVAALRQEGLEGADEYRLLIDAREMLESGKEFRAVRAGPGFTRKLMGEIENDAPGRTPSRIPTATIVAILCGLVILAAIGYVGYRSVSGKPNSQTAIEDLYKNSQGFLDTVAVATFKGSIPQGWHAIGALPLDVNDGLRPAPQAGGEKNLGGGVVRTNALPATQAFAVDVTLHGADPTPAVLLEAFVSADENFSDKGTSAKELVWQLRSREQQVLLSGSSQRVNSPPTFAAGDVVRIIVDPSVAIVEVVPAAGGKPLRIWAGPHELGQSPRHVGVRFLQTGIAGKPDISVQQIKVTTSPG